MIYKLWEYRTLRNPFVMAMISIVLSEIAYVSVSLLAGFEIFRFWVIFTASVSGSIAFFSTLLISKLTAKIERQNDELDRLNQLNQELFSTISHDIRSPLTGIILLLDMVKKGQIKIEETNYLIEELSLDIEHLIRFLDELLVWSKRQIDKKPLSPELVETKPVIESTIQLYSPIISQKEINISMKSISGFIYADKGSYSFVIRNVLQNAIKFTPKGGQIELSVEQQNGHVITKVKDSGVGMNAEKIEQILTQTHYETTTGTAHETGVGFGLKASITYLNKQNGSMEITSNQESGTEVRISLPKTSTP